jgi:hypothetical protein
MTYSPFSTDDGDLEDWIRQQAESGALDDLASPSPMQPLAAYQAPPHAEMAPLKLDTGPDWSDALGAGTTALASLFDLGLNHGHGTGQILAAGGQFGQARAEQRLKGTQDALSYEQKRAELERQNNYNDYLYANLAKRTGATGATTAYQQSQLDARKATESRLEQERQDRIANSKAADEDRDAARTDREQQFQLSMEDRKAAREAAEADRADRAAERQQTQADRAQERADKKETGDTDQFLQRTNETRAQAAALKGAETIIDDPKYAKDLPGVGEADSRFPEWMMHPFDPQQRQDAIKLQSLAGTAGQYFKHEITGSASSDREQRMLLGLKGLQSGATEEEFRTSIGIWKEELQNELRARSTTNPAAARKALDAQGIGDWSLGPAQQSAPQAQAPAADSFGMTNYGPDADHPSNLGVTGPPGVRNTPTFRATPGGGAATARGGQMGPVGGMASGSTAGGGIMVRSPSGNVDQVSPEQWQQLQSMAGWSRVQ